MNNGKLSNIVEALLFAAAEPLSATAMSRVLDGTKTSQIAEAVDTLNERYISNESALRVREVAGGYQLHSLPEYAQYIEDLLAKTKKQRLSRAALETLAIIAYRQPVTGPEIDAIRGVDSSGVLRKLLERNVIAITGRSEKPGRPLLYGTTKEFLYYFGLNDLRDLPRMAEIEALLNQPKQEAQLELSSVEMDSDNGEGVGPRAISAVDLRPIATTRSVPKTKKEAPAGTKADESESSSPELPTDQQPEITIEPVEDDRPSPTKDTPPESRSDEDEDDGEDILQAVRDVVTSSAE